MSMLDDIAAEGMLNLARVIGSDVSYRIVKRMLEDMNQLGPTVPRSWSRAVFDAWKKETALYELIAEGKGTL
jgi:hypothetical protein